MSELSMIGKIIKALETAKQTGVGVEFSKFDAIELLGHIKSLEEAYGLAEREVAELREQTRWIPVEEILPENGSKVLVFIPGIGCEIAMYLNLPTIGYVGFRVGGAACNSSVTHWMPLPKPPEDE